MTSDGQILAPPASSGEDADPRRWLTLVILLLAALMNLLDVSIVNIAVPSIQRDLGASYADIQWALAGYTLAYALVLITGGRLGDTFGRKRLLLIGVAGFTAMSALCGAAQSPGQLLGALLIERHMLGLDWRPIFLSNIPGDIVALDGGAARERGRGAPGERK